MQKMQKQTRMSSVNSSDDSVSNSTACAIMNTTSLPLKVVHKRSIQRVHYIKKIAEQFGSFDAWLSTFKAIALTRGIGWAILYYDTQTGKLLNTWVEEQHLGHLTGLAPILALDVWEHAYVADYHPSGKKQYVEDFFTNLNWSVIEKNFEKVK